MKNIICINCSKKGHTFKDCKFPVTSYGILAYKKNKDDFYFLLVQRKDSIGYLDFVRGKYDSNMKKEDMFRILIGEMTMQEKNKLLTMTFDEIWNTLWLNHNSRIYKNEYTLAKKKFESIDIKNMIKSSIIETKWDKQEFCIPKGRRNHYENILDCAIREFVEETGYTNDDINIRLDYDPVYETFFGSNGISYKHIYFLAEITTDRSPNVNCKNVFQAGEIKHIGWFSYKQAMNIFRLYDTTKRYIINKVYKFLLSK